MKQLAGVYADADLGESSAYTENDVESKKTNCQELIQTKTNYLQY